MCASACCKGDFASLMSVRRTCVKAQIDLPLYFLPPCLKSHALVIAVYADAKVIWSVGMMEADVSPIASEWTDALLQEVGCQVSALITQWGWLREDGRLQEGGCLVSVPQIHSAALAFTARPTHHAIQPGILNFKQIHSICVQRNSQLNHLLGSHWVDDPWP